MSISITEGQKQDLKALGELEKESMAIHAYAKRCVRDKREPLDYVLLAECIGSYSKAALIICRDRLKDNNPSRTIRTDAAHPENRREKGWTQFDEWS